MRPIFNTTAQAVHFSFLIQAYEASPESQMGKMMRRAAEEVDGTHRSTVHLDGLNPLEIRGQCALIRGAIAHQLPKPEADAMRARYGLVMTRNLPDGTREVELSEERHKAIFDLADYLLPQFQNIPRLALVHLVMREVGNLSAMQYPFKTIEQLCGGSHSTMHREFPKLRDKIHALEKRALLILTPIFERDGVVDAGYAYA